jgi:hypothetical protein
MQNDESSRLKAELEKVLGSLEELLSVISFNQETDATTKKCKKIVSKAIINSENCCLLSRNLLHRSMQEESACQNESMNLLNARDKNERLRLRVEELKAQLDSDTPPPNSLTTAVGHLLSQRRQFDDSVRTLNTISIASAVHTARMDGGV